MNKSMIYLDNAATTIIDDRVKEAMMPLFETEYGNPSSIYKLGKQAKNILENARSTVAKLLGTVPGEVFFTSGGTESNNTAIIGTVIDRKIKHVITSPLEHHAVLHTVEYLNKYFDVAIHFVNIDKDGQIDMDSFTELTRKYPNSMLSLMNANNEIGNIYDIATLSQIGKETNCIVHTDAVQVIGHLPFSFENANIDFATASAHKFHGPKGTGVLLMKEGLNISSLIHGGGQERNFRAGTENVMGIVGFAKALELGVEEMEMRKRHILELKSRMIELLKEKITGVKFNGLSCNMDGDKSLYTVLNANIPYNGNPDMLLFILDIAGIAASGGSACSSGSFNGSHVINAIKEENTGYVPIRFSFSHYNEHSEIDTVVDRLVNIVNVDRLVNIVNNKE